MNYLVIGGSFGIGKSIVDILSQDSTNTIYVCNRTSTEELKANIKFQYFDVLDDSKISFELSDVIDGVVYCPGSINLKPFGRLSEQDFLNEYKLNVLGAIKVLQYALPNLRKSPNASIVLFSTVAAKIGMPFHSSIASAKGAIEGLTRSLAAEFAPSIRVNAIAPSLTSTRLSEKLLNTVEKMEASNKRHPLNKYGKPQDLAEAACFLLSEKSSWITGQVLAVDGGLSSLKV
jgi:NAD(P)-dependent dehydrogenase (short-subunit alcohol dehydrogenase family)